MLALNKYLTHCFSTCLAIVTIFVTSVAYTAKPFIIDTDAGIDDVIAILYLLQRPDIQIKAITIAADGSAHCKPALHNIHGLLQLAKHPNIPIACGMNKPMFGEHHFPVSILNESDTLAGTAKLLPHLRPDTQKDAVDLIIKTILEASEPITILAIGPLTNIAQALQKAPQIKKHIKSIYIMGGGLLMFLETSLL